jgi:hypothetical protein
MRILRSVGLILLLLAACRIGFDVHDSADSGLSGEGSGGDGRDASAAVPPASMQDLCVATRITAIRGGVIPDDTMATNLAQTIAATCTPAPAVRTVGEGDPGILDPTTSRPLLAVDDLGIEAGGGANQMVIGYLFAADTPLTFSDSGTRVVIKERASGTALVDQPTSAYNVSHDVAVIMLTYEPIGGATVLSLVGRAAKGTAASGYWFSNILIPTISTANQRWYVLDWVDSDSNSMPSAADTYTIIAMGP